MLELFSAFDAEVATQPQWIQVWLKILVGVLALSVPFSFVRIEARWTLLGLVLGVAGVMSLYSQFGYSRVLGFGHIIPWTPLVAYLLLRRAHWRVRETWAGKWIVTAVSVLLISLAFDYVDVIRWLAGDRA
ncbi:hypothetical protein [Hyphomonas johnsonii]|uniref:Transmembrane protein n=1 Tax=Hyphomonas johnsonii MHS-2 TaxID=1280950 RepID=A0A059F9S0_9PROT|nr:hypothetical protein [Hyphomonas johnsonii]KCZ87347.1 hypothetical protein HJO_16912 [Hyphomonas johnsonii MHS-2]